MTSHFAAAAIDGSALSAELIESAAALEALRPEWEALWARCPGATPFQWPAWLIAWWRHFAPGALFSVAVRRAGRLVALAPFYVETGAQGRRVLGIGISLSDYLDVLIDPACGEAGNAIVARLAAEAGRWDGWDLEDLAPGAAAFGLPCPAGCTEAASDTQTAPVLALPASVEALGECIPARKLRKLRMARNRAARRGAVALIHADASEMDELLDVLFALHRARWESCGVPGGVLRDPRVERFQRDAAPELLRAGMLRLYALRIDGRVVGAYYGLAHGVRAYAYLGGFDPDYAFESPGTILIGHAIEEAVREGAREFHFLRGPEAYKYEWGAADRRNRRRSFRRAAPS